MKKPRDKYFSFYKDSNFLRFRQFFLERDLLRIACSLFEAEKRLKKYGSLTRITIPLSEETFDRINKKRLKNVLEELFLLILSEDILVQIKKIDDVKKRVRKEISFPKMEAICLFSAGVDSYAGINMAKKEYKNLLGVFIAHNDQSRIIKMVEEIKPKINSPIKTIYAPSMGSTGYSQFRGFLYILAGGIYLKLCDAKKILVTECGPTMYQPLFSPYDSITYTTHPYVLKAAKDVLTIILGFSPEIIIPFEDLTKAEVMANSGIKDFSKTHSCISQRFGNHDGTCFGCVIKKLGALVSGVNDVQYNKDIFDEETDQDNLLNILIFSETIIKDYDKLFAFQKTKIKEFDKEELFRRYSLDNLAGLMIGTNSQNFLHQRFISPDFAKILKKRMEEVRTNKKKPNFKKIV